MSEDVRDRIGLTQHFRNKQFLKEASVINFFINITLYFDVRHPRCV